MADNIRNCCQTLFGSKHTKECEDEWLNRNNFEPMEMQPIEMPSKSLERTFSEMNKDLERLEQARIDSLHKAEFIDELRKLINRYSMENGSGTPDFILASYLAGCLDNWNETVAFREKWYDRKQDAFGMPLNQHGASTAE